MNRGNNMPQLQFKSLVKKHIPLTDYLSQIINISQNVQIQKYDRM